MKPSLSKAEDLASTPAFQKSEISLAWQEFVSLAKERIQFLEEASAEVTLRACHNLECGNIQEKQHSRRCSGWKSFYYCSQACQVNDWQHGGHRKACYPYGRIGLTSHMKSAVISRERSLLRAYYTETTRCKGEKS
ncbi:hypothetical protein C8R47DRAFT_219394 [Mycena vitilis]|nr:hypothetical protein C8R47DRAFT_219394 [Mycena vitilis]